MKTYRTIDEAIYDMAGGRVVRRKNNPLVPLVMLFAGLALIVAVFFIGNNTYDTSLTSGLLLGGILLAFAGAVKTVIDLTGKGAPYHVPSHSKLRRYELVFDTPYMMKVCQCVNDGDLDSLTTLPKGHSSEVVAVIYKSEDEKLVMAQVFGRKTRYSHPLTETRVFENGKYVTSGEPA